jgi:hypothetical protein
MLLGRAGLLPVGFHIGFASGVAVVEQLRARRVLRWCDPLQNEMVRVTSQMMAERVMAFYSAVFSRLIVTS